MSDVLSAGVPQQVADLFDTKQVRFVHGWGDRDGETCLLGALLRPCAVPGDEVMWSVLLSHRGLTMGWNDDRTEAQVVAKLREQVDPTEAEMVAVFGSRWVAARDICRRWAAATDAEKDAAWAAWAAGAAWAAWAAGDAWAAWAAGDAGAARAARDAWAAWDARAAWDAGAARAAWAAWDAGAARAARAARDAFVAWDAWDARDARDAFVAVCASDYLTEGTAWNQAAYDRLIAPWEAVFGPIDAPDVPGETP